MKRRGICCDEICNKCGRERDGGEAMRPCYTRRYTIRRNKVELVNNYEWLFFSSFCTLFMRNEHTNVRTMYEWVGTHTQEGTYMWIDVRVYVRT
ncbi:hypothetical protein POVWA2_018320 [Plasmodium ovale wallikeri]|uniref:Uncharacterized protein n=1 Tax=Plasmodium ovale wallikeri TaxID=864142 RepID=A0A1A8YR55_PLAOA|nr:hypothetical protein POVWA1_018410 [Plasmodium ovale wallikeri]SBT34115.1 hypothetical protein POVWA2_018320 [Plasmodium ovale wallikeri]